MSTSGSSFSPGRQVNPLYLATLSSPTVSTPTTPRIPSSRHSFTSSSSPSSSQRYLQNVNSIPTNLTPTNARSSRSLSLPVYGSDTDEPTPLTSPSTGNLNNNSSRSFSPLAVSSSSVLPKDSSPPEEKFPPLMIIKLPDGSQVLGVKPEIAKEYDEATVSHSTNGGSNNTNSSSPLSRNNNNYNLSSHQSALNILNSLSSESHQMITTALTNANSLTELRELGFDLDSDGWLTLPNSERIFLPQYLYAQDIALRTARRNAEFEGIRSYLVKATTLARYVRRLSFFHLGMAGLQILTTNFSGIFGIFASGGCFGARFGRIKILLIYILYCLYVIGISIWTYFVWIKQSKNEGADVVFGTGIMRLNAVIVSVVCFVSIVAIVVTIHLIIVLRQIFKKGYAVDQNRASNGQFALSRRRLRAPRGDTINEPTMLLNNLPLYASLGSQNRTNTIINNPLTIRSPESISATIPTIFSIDNPSNHASISVADRRN